MKVRKVLSVCLLVLTPALYVAAQDDQQDRRDDATRRQATATARDTTSGDASQNLEKDLATKLIIKNQEEIELARFAMEKTQNDEVRQFAQKLIQDHSQFIEQLQKFEPKMEFATLDSQGSRAIPTSTRRPGTRGQDDQDRTRPDQERGQQDRQPGQDQQPGQQPGQQQQDRAQDQNRDAQGGQAQAGRRQQPGQPVSARTGAAATANKADAHLQIAQEAARLCLDMTKEKLGAKEGKEFDVCFVGGQIFAHVGMVAHLQAMQQVASPEFSQVLEQGISTSQEHMKHAEMLAQQLEGQQGQQREQGQQGAAGRLERRTQQEGARERTERPDVNPNQ